MPTTKTGEKITWKEFMRRWKKGIEGITPLQQVKSQVWGTNIILLGLILGIIASAFAFKKLWWVEIILIGALFNTIIQWIGLWQKRKLLESFEDFIEDSEFNKSNSFYQTQENLSDVMKGGKEESVIKFTKG